MYFIFWVYFSLWIWMFNSESHYKNIRYHICVCVCILYTHYTYINSYFSFMYVLYFCFMNFFFFLHFWNESINTKYIHAVRADAASAALMTRSTSSVTSFPFRSHFKMDINAGIQRKNKHTNMIYLLNVNNWSVHGVTLCCSSCPVE